MGRFKVWITKLFTDDYVGKDGFARNLGKLGSEYRILKAAMKPSWLRFKNAPDTHSYTDLFVESCRASAYFMGHVYAVLLPFLVIGIPAFFVWAKISG